MNQPNPYMLSESVSEIIETQRVLPSNGLKNRRMLYCIVFLQLTQVDALAFTIHTFIRTFFISRSKLIQLECRITSLAYSLHIMHIHTRRFLLHSTVCTCSSYGFHRYLKRQNKKWENNLEATSKLQVKPKVKKTKFSDKRFIVKQICNYL